MTITEELLFACNSAPGRSAAQTREEAEQFRAFLLRATAPTREYLPRELWRDYRRRRQSARETARRFLAWRANLSAHASG